MVSRCDDFSMATAQEAAGEHIRTDSPGLMSWTSVSVAILTICMAEKMSP